MLVPVPPAVLPAVSVALTLTVMAPSVKVLRSAVPPEPVTLVVPSLKVTVAVASVSSPVTE